MKLYFEAFAMCQSMFCAIVFPIHCWNEKARDKMLLFLPLVGLEIGFLWAFAGYLATLVALPKSITAGLKQAPGDSERSPCRFFCCYWLCFIDAFSVWLFFEREFRRWNFAFSACCQPLLLGSGNYCSETHVNLSVCMSGKKFFQNYHLDSDASLLYCSRVHPFWKIRIRAAWLYPGMRMFYYESLPQSGWHEWRYLRLCHYHG